MEQLKLFSEKKIIIPETEGIKYAGSKREIIPNILKVFESLESKSFFDGFSGTTRVSQAFAKRGYEVWGNDISHWSYIFGLCYLKNKKPKEYYQKLIDHLNTLKGVEGWFTQNYGGSGKYKNSDEGDGKKKLWQYHNTKKLDAIRVEIDLLTENKIERAVLLTSLILAMDKVDNSLGHHTSYLRNWAPRSFHKVKLEVPNFPEKIHAKNKVTQKDIFQVLKNNEAEVFYFDPPYGSSNEKMPPSRVRYASYYHVWTSIIKNDHPKVVGASNRREDVSDTLSSSVFEEFRRSKSGRFIATEAIEKLLQLSPAPYIVLSYSNEGRATQKELLEICGDFSKDFAIIKENHKSHVMKAMRWSQEWISEEAGPTKEFLFVLSTKGKFPKKFKESVFRKDISCPQNLTKASD